MYSGEKNENLPLSLGRFHDGLLQGLHHLKKIDGQRL